ncbi:Lrp/AsnC family transcriptional regulator [Paludibacterium paludis]|uniref:Transcription regulator AsnC/Lrp ligand binding domain-containing protein n=1 Tax=Paludibacterium paludis TaxID=1225769 RepID=A0A918P6U6_9NEIS|nr:Lrp/AsnC family transcriptional regulator [Paludibacterium paludis]GGY28218.1 hypothetical protein GCM10011289_34300 [Paludibacterium paludis]
MIAERLRRPEDAGVIEGYHARVAARRLGYPLMARIGITVPQPKKNAFIAFLEGLPEVLECHHVTGGDSYSYLFRVAARDTEHLETLVGTLSHPGETRTSLILSTPIPPRALHPVR